MSALPKTVDAVIRSPAPAAQVLPLEMLRRPTSARMHEHGKAVLSAIVPPLVVLALLLGVWELLCNRQGATLPPPSREQSDTWELIVDPFFDRGGIDKGLFWHLIASLQRVALGYALAAAAGIGLGVLVGQSTWAMRGLDPIFQV